MFIKSIMSNNTKTQNTEKANMNTYGFYSPTQREVMGFYIQYYLPSGKLVKITEIIRSLTLPQPNKNYPDSCCLGKLGGYYNTIYDRPQNTEKANMKTYGFYSPTQRKVYGRCLQYLRPDGRLVWVTETIRSNTTPKPNSYYPDSCCLGEVESYQNTIHDRPQNTIHDRPVSY